MKKLLFVLVAFATLSISMFGQSPEGFNYQAVIRNASNEIVANQPVGLRMTLQQGSIGGTTVYSETFSVTTTTNGLVNVQIGGGSVLSGTFANIAWANGPFFIETAVDATGGSNYVVMGTSQLMSVPYALYAKTSGSTQNLQQVLVNGNNANGNNLLNTGTIGVGTATPSAGASVEIATALPIIFPRMNQNQINALTPTEGMVQYNTTAKKLQVYGMLTDNTDVLNEIYIGNESGPFGQLVNQTFSSPVDGQVIAVELMFKNAMSNPTLSINFQGQGSYAVPSYSQFTWHTFILTNPIPVSAGGMSSFSFIGLGVDTRSFATNSNYPNGSLACCLNTPDDDVLFRVHIQPVPGSFGWQNLN